MLPSSHLAFSSGDNHPVWLSESPQLPSAMFAGHDSQHTQCVG